MALSEFEIARVMKVVGAYVESVRPAAHLRAQVDVSFRIKNQSVEIFSIRPSWNGQPGELMEEPAAKATYVRTSDHWEVFWMPASRKWKFYEPAPAVDAIEDFVELVRADAWSCFWG